MKPRLLDLFCGAGGAGMGYHRAGFEVVGVDIAPQPRYPFTFIQADALTFPLDGFDAIHASPPCQAWSALSRATGRAADHPQLIETVRRRLEAHGAPWVIENVPGAPMPAAFRLCGMAMGIEVVRHRLFESNVFILVPPCACGRNPTITGRAVAFRHSGRVDFGRTVPPRRSQAEWVRAVGVEWMRRKDARQAIPPAYTEFVGAQLLAALELSERAS